MLAGMMLASMAQAGSGLIARGFIGPELVGLIVAISFAAGLNVYATVATLGLLAHTRWVALPPGLHALTSWWIIGASLALFAIEFFADKIPAFDLFWNALHTFVRIPVAALMAYGATSQLSPEMQLLATLAGGAIALAAHGGKTAARVAVTPSPEPVSNFTLSAGEDVLAVFVTWLATHHPIAAGVIALVFLVAIVAAVRWVWKTMVQTLRSLFGRPQNVNESPVL
ncbi:MAG: DUF4126 domain-containing protein [Acidobacteriaceae bacterium]